MNDKQTKIKNGKFSWLDKLVNSKILPALTSTGKMVAVGKEEALEMRAKLEKQDADSDQMDDILRQLIERVQVHQIFCDSLYSTKAARSGHFFKNCNRHQNWNDC